MNEQYWDDGLFIDEEITIRTMLDDEHGRNFEVVNKHRREADDTQFIKTTKYLRLPF